MRPQFKIRDTNSVSNTQVCPLIPEETVGDNIFRLLQHDGHDPDSKKACGR